VTVDNSTRPSFLPLKNSTQPSVNFSSQNPGRVVSQNLTTSYHPGNFPTGNKTYNFGIPQVQPAEKNLAKSESTPAELALLISSVNPSHPENVSENPAEEIEDTKNRRKSNSRVRQKYDRLSSSISSQISSQIQNQQQSEQVEFHPEPCDHPKNTPDNSEILTAKHPQNQQQKKFPETDREFQAESGISEFMKQSTRPQPRPQHLKLKRSKTVDAHPASPRSLILDCSRNLGTIYGGNSENSVNSTTDLDRENKELLESIIMSEMQDDSGISVPAKEKEVLCGTCAVCAESFLAYLLLGLHGRYFCTKCYEHVLTTASQKGVLHHILN